LGYCSDEDLRWEYFSKIFGYKGVGLTEQNRGGDLQIKFYHEWFRGQRVCA
jgi:hypothetical protein